MKFVLMGATLDSFVQYPVYFAYEDDNVKDVLREISANDAAGRPATATTGGYVYSISLHTRGNISTMVAYISILSARN